MNNILLIDPIPHFFIVYPRPPNSYKVQNSMWAHVWIKCKHCMSCLQILIICLYFSVTQWIYLLPRTHWLFFVSNALRLLISRTGPHSYMNRASVNYGASPLSGCHCYTNIASVKYDASRSKYESSTSQLYLLSFAVARSMSSHFQDGYI